jgi:parallel beta-helix repeat protein
VDGAGNAYVTGDTKSTDFPTSNPLQQTFAGGLTDAFVAKVNPSASGIASLVFSTYLGGNGWDIGQGIAVDGAGNAYVVGVTSSSDFPDAGHLPAANPITNPDFMMVFVAKLPTRGPLTYTTPMDGFEHELVLQRDGAFLELTDNGLVVAYRVYDGISSVSIAVTNGLSALMIINDSNGPIDVPGGIAFDGGTGGSILQVNDQALADGPISDYQITNSQVIRRGIDIFSLPQITISYQHVARLEVNGPNQGSPAFDIRSTLADTPVELDTGPCTNTIHVGDGLLGSVQADVTLKGQGGANDLTVDDSATAGPVTYTLGAITVMRAGAGTIQYSGMTSLVLDAGGGTNTIAVEATRAGTPTTINVGTGTNTINVGAGYLGFLSSQLTVDAQGGTNTLTLNDSGAPGPLTYDLAFGTVHRSGAAAISYSGLTSLVLDGGSGGNTINVGSTEIATTVNAGSGATNTINVGSGLLGFLFSNLTVKGQGATNALTIDDSTTAGPVTYTVTSSSVGRVGQASTTTYTGMSSLVLKGGAGGNTFKVTSTAAGCATTLDGGSGRNTFTGSFSGDFNGSLTLAGFEAATLDVAGSFNGSLLASGLGTTAQPIQEITVGGSVAAAATIKVGVLAALTIHGDLAGTLKGFGDPTNASFPAIGALIVGGSFLSSASYTAPVLGTITVAGNSAGTVNETNPTQDLQQLTVGGSFTATAVVHAASIAAMTVGQNFAGQVTVTGALGTLHVAGTLSGTVAATTLDSLAVDQDFTGQVTITEILGSLVVGGSLLGNVTSPVVTSAVINGTGNDDTFVISPTSVSLNGNTVLSATYAALTVNGLAGNDRFILAGAGMPVTLNGGDGNDTFQLNDGAGITGAIDGGAGFNTLDYRAYTTPANVDLGTGQATGVAGGAQNIENVLGATVSITVTNTADSGPGSLRQAILAANAHPGADTITFHIPGSGVHTIAPLSPLPDVTDPATIDGYSQPGASANTLTVGDNAVLLIQLDGTRLGAGFSGLHITAGDSTVQGLDITSFMRAGAPTFQGGVAILLDTKGGNVIQGNFIGTGPTGTVALGNVFGLFLDATSSNNLIGGTAPGARNLIAGNQDGVYTDGTATRIEGNYIGTNAAGSAALANTEDGVVVTAASTIGGTAPGAGNLIAGNNRFGVALINSTQGSVVQGNLIGLDATGSYAVGNNWGIVVGNSDFNQIGGTTAAARNVISGNASFGIELGDPRGGNVIQGNYIGTNAGGTAAVGNVHDGIFIADSSSNTVAGNVISGNGLHGILIASAPGFDAARNVVQGNRIGTNAAGNGALGNHGDGVHIDAGAHDNQIGDGAPGAGNLIAFNGGAGVVVADASSINNTIRGNAIYNNSGLGTDLGDDGVTPNGLPPRSGPNQLQNFPTLQVAGLVAGGTGVVGSLDSLPGTAYTVDFYANVAADASGFGQGQTYLGSTAVTTDSSGHATFAQLLPAVAPGSVIAASATDPAGNTSEFSADVSLQPLADLDVSAAGVLQYTASAGVANNLTVSLAAGTYTFNDTGERIFVTGAGSTGFSGTGTITVTCPAGAVSSIVVDTGDGSDTIHVASAIGVPVSIDGGTGANTLVGPDMINTWQVSGANQGSLNANVTFARIQNLTGGAASDAFAFATSGRLDGTLDGAGGVNTLDYSAYAGNIVVDLPLGLATGVAGGIGHIWNVTGSVGNDLIVGDANPNLLIGGTGRNVIIGGAGGDTIKEVAANTGDNLLIGGTTDYDLSLAALNAIFAEWTRADLGFNDRASDLLNGTNAQGATPLNTLNGQLVLLNNVTVHADNALDTLTGGGKGSDGTGTGRNWFFVDSDDIITNYLTGKNGDKKTKVQ